MDEALPIAIRAEAGAGEANRRLDKMNGSIDRLGDAVEETNKKVDAILLKLAGEDGAAKARGVFILTRRFVVSTCAVLLTSSLAAAAITLLLRRHNG